MSNVPQSKRDQHLAGSGVELKSDDTQFDVVTWREQVQTLHTDTNTKLDSVVSELQGTLTVIETFHKNIHLGRSFMAHHNSSSLANGS